MSGTLSCVKTNRLWAQENTHMFDEDENNYELWEVKFLGYMRLQKLHEVVIREESEKDAPDAGKLANAFAELVQCLFCFR